MLTSIGNYNHVLTHAINLEVRLLQEYHRPPPNHRIYDAMQLTKGPHPIFWPLLGVPSNKFVLSECQITLDGFLWYMKIKKIHRTPSCVPDPVL
jgi:hypothetical protein